MSLQDLMDKSEVRGMASSHYTRETITTRMAKIAAMEQTAAVVEETAYLQMVLDRWDREHGGE